jgi:hypothetical protein
VAAQTALALSGATLPVRPAAGAVAVDHDPRVIGRDPADGQPVAGGPVIVRYRDEDGGSGIDVGRVRLWVGGRDVTPLAEVTPFGLQLAQDAVPAGAVRVALVIADRAGNVGRARWTIVGPREAQGR